MDQNEYEIEEVDDDDDEAMENDYGGEINEIEDDDND